MNENLPKSVPRPEVTKEQWEAWRADPVTIELMRWARRSLIEKHEIWEFGGLTANDHFQTALNNASAIGACSVLREIEALEYEVLTRE